ncbi:MAG: VOC family protein [Anaerolineae bacterium]|nr:VOC family protein [Anaerolineae bacterium]
MPNVIHFEIHATEPKILVDFYTNLFGWKISQWEGPMEYYLVDSGEAALGGAIQRRPEGTPPGDHPVNAFVCTVEVEDLEAMLGKSTALGASIQLPKMPVPGIGWMAYIKDPDGNLLGMMQTDAQAA